MLIVLLSHSGSGDRRVAVDDRRLAAVVGRPVVAHRQAELVGLAGRLAVQREVAHAPATRGPGSPAFMPGVRDDEPAVVEHEVADEAVEEVARLLAQLAAARGRAARASRRARA